MITLEDTDFWMRLVAAVQYGGAAACVKLWNRGGVEFLPKYNILHNAIPNGAAELYKAFSKISEKLKSEGKKGKKLTRFSYQSKMVLPESGETELRFFDVTLHVELLMTLTTIKDEVTPNRRSLEKLDVEMDILDMPAGFNKVGDCLEYLRELRNFLIHYPAREMSEEDFHMYWDFLEKILEGLDYEKEYIADLKKSPSNVPPGEEREDYETAVVRGYADQVGSQAVANVNDLLHDRARAINYAMQIRGSLNINMPNATIIGTQIIHPPAVQDSNDIKVERLQERVRQLEHAEQELKDEKKELKEEKKELKQQNKKLLDIVHKCNMSQQSSQ